MGSEEEIRFPTRELRELRPSLISSSARNSADFLLANQIRLVVSTFTQGRSKGRL